MSQRSDSRAGRVLTSVLAGLAGGLVVVLLLGAPLAVLIPAGLGVGVVAIVAAVRHGAREGPQVESRSGRP